MADSWLEEPNASSPTVVRASQPEPPSIRIAFPTSRAIRIVTRSTLTRSSERKVEPRGGIPTAVRRHVGVATSGRRTREA
jgi:hypothetical protein